MFFSPKTSADGLVFHYDTGNTVRSYLGEPTVNLATNTPSLGGWPGSYTVVDSTTKTFDFTTSTVEWGGDASWTTFYYDVSAYTGQYVTISATFEYSSDPNKFNFLWIGQTSGSETYLGYSPEADRNQKSTDNREDISWSGVVGSGGKVGILIWMSNGTSTTVTARISNIQVEVKSHKTPFTAGTRSATQGLKDLTAANTINLSNVSFDANAQMTFDGTDDYVITSNFPQLSNWTTELFLKPTVYTSAQKVILDVNLGIRFEISNGFFNSHFGNGSGWIYTNLPSTTSIAANKWFHVVVTVQSGGQAKVYVNSVLENSTNIGSGTTPNVPLYVGRYTGGSGYEFNGEIPVTKIYNRALTTNEVARNYNAIKSRFNIG